MDNGGDVVLMKRYLLVLALVFFLTATIFVVSSTGYDPWIDYDEDGTVDYDDFISLAGEYGTSGDPTRNVNVTNFPSRQPEPSWKAINIVENLNITWDTTDGYVMMIDPFYFYVPVEGYSRMVVHARVLNHTDVGGISPSDTNEAGVQILWWYLCDHGHPDLWDGSLGYGDLYWETDYDIHMPINVHSGLEVTLGPMLKMDVRGWSNTQYTPRPSTISCLVSIGIYLRNE